MCRKKSEGGRRCSHNRKTHALLERTQQSVDEFIAENGNDWAGDITDFIVTQSPMVALAYELAVRSHANVRRTSGEAYINHPLRVATRLQQQGFNEEVVAVALLHDAVEDSPLTLTGLRRWGFNERVVSGVDSVTKRKGEDPMESVARAAAHPIGRLVKTEDNLDNSADEQTAPLPIAKRYRVKVKYIDGRRILMNSFYSETDEEMFERTPHFTRTYQIRRDNSDMVYFTS